MDDERDDEAKECQNVLYDKEFVAPVAKGCESAYVDPQQQYESSKASWDAQVCRPFQLEDSWVLFPSLYLEYNVKHGHKKHDAGHPSMENIESVVGHAGEETDPVLLAG